MRAHARMLDFSVGDRVSFQLDGRPALFSILTRYNKKTVTVITEAGEHWTVSPHLLRKVVDVAADAPAGKPSTLALNHHPRTPDNPRISAAHMLPDRHQGDSPC